MNADNGEAEAIPDELSAVAIYALHKPWGVLTLDRSTIKEDLGSFRGIFGDPDDVLVPATEAAAT